eukprot:IDg1083t1
MNSRSVMHHAAARAFHPVGKLRHALPSCTQAQLAALLIPARNADRRNNLLKHAFLHLNGTVSVLTEAALPSSDRGGQDTNEHQVKKAFEAFDSERDMRIVASVQREHASHGRTSIWHETA